MNLIRIVLLALFLLTTWNTNAQSSDEATIRSVLDRQSSSWNRGNLEGFMNGYWENDSLMFIGKKGITYGWRNTLDNYKKSYPDKTAMGQLQFDIVKVRPLSDEYYQVTGKWKLSRSIGDLEGYFTLLFRKIKGRWVIIADHSS